MEMMELEISHPGISGVPIKISGVATLAVKVGGQELFKHDARETKEGQNTPSRPAGADAPKSGPIIVPGMSSGNPNTVTGPQAGTPVGTSEGDTIELKSGTGVLPWPTERNAIYTVNAPIGYFSLSLDVPADASGSGWIKGRAAKDGPDNFHAGSSLSHAMFHFYDATPYGDMGISFQVGPTDVQGVSNLRPGQRYYLNVNKQYDGPLVIQFLRP